MYLFNRRQQHLIEEQQRQQMHVSLPRPHASAQLIEEEQQQQQYVDKGTGITVDVPTPIEERYSNRPIRGGPT